jgi:hypothetical protein
VRILKKPANQDSHILGDLTSKFQGAAPPGSARPFLFLPYAAHRD